MADEAILKIVTVGQGGSAGGGGGGGGGGGTPAGAASPAQPPSTFGAVGQIAGKIGGIPGAAGQVVSAAGGLGSAAGSLGAVAGAVGLVVALKALTDQAAQAAQSVGTFAAGMLSASASPAEFVAKQGQAISQFSDAIFFVSPIVGIFGKALGTATTIIGEFMQAMDGMVERYAQYSPALAIAQAQAEVTQVLADMRRAREATPALLEYIKARTELQQKFEDAKIRFMERVTPLLISGMDTIEKFLPIFEAVLDIIVQIGETIPGIGDKVNEIRQRMDKDQLQTNMEDLASVILGQVQGPSFPFEAAGEGGARSPLTP